MTDPMILWTKAAAWTEWLDELHRRSPEWAAKLAAAPTKQELKHVASQLAMQLVEQIAASERRQGTVRDQLQKFMATNLHRRPALKDLSAFWGYSEKYCSELFRNLTGESFSDALKRLRVQKAKRLLAETPMTIAGIAESLGFSDQFAFSHFFKNAVGCSPKQFRMGVRNPSGLPGALSHHFAHHVCRGGPGVLPTDSRPRAAEPEGSGPTRTTKKGTRTPGAAHKRFPTP